MTLHAQAAQRRDAQIDAAHASDTLRKAKRAIMALLFMALPALAQPYNTPPKPAEFPIADRDGNGTLNANDFQRFQNDFAVAKSWVDDLTTNAPGQVSGLGALVAAQTVTLTWTNASRPQTAVYILRAGQVIKTLAGNAATTTDAPGGGTWVYSVTTGNSVNGFNYPPIAPAPSVSVTVTGAPPPPTDGWTLFSTPEAAFYVSSGGNDSAAGTQAAPFRTIAKGYASLRDGHEDWVYLKAGDTFNESITWGKSARAVGKYMGIGCYGATAATPRALIRTSGQAFYLGTSNTGQGLAFVSLDIQPTGHTTSCAAVTMFEFWRDVLVEDCALIGYPVNYVAQEISMPNRLSGLKIRRCVLADSWESGAGHSQNVFWGSVDNGLLEENIVDKAARNQNNIFDHGFYLNESCGTSIVRGNILARNSSHGCQQRSGGTADWNLCLQNGVNFYQGSGGDFKNNYSLDARDINGTDRRGLGFVIGGSVSNVRGNIAAHQVTGTDAIIAYDVDFNSGSFVGNVAWKWGLAANNVGWPTAVQWDGGGGAVEFGNNLLAFGAGQFGMCVRHESRPVGSVHYYSNRYFTASEPNGLGGYLPFATGPGSGANWTQWKAAAGEAGSTFAPQPNIDATMTAYLTSIGVAAGSDAIDTFMQKARAQSKAAWDDRFTAKAVIVWAQAKFGLTAAP